MGMLRMGEKIRLTGSDASEYLNMTGRSTLPTSASEFNRALDDTAKVWLQADCAEGDLLAALAEDSKID